MIFTEVLPRLSEYLHAVIQVDSVATRASRLRPDEAELIRAAAFRGELRRFLHRTDAVAKQAGLTSQRYDLLLTVASLGEVRITELCGLLHLQQTAVTELVKRTEEAGLIRRRQSAEDGRVWLLELTAEGERRLMRAFAALREDRHALAAAFRDVDRSFRAASR
jgi:DNA-binding MarR family transcriptional regulator